MKELIIEKRYRGRPLNECQKQTNKKHAKTRCRVEYIFGFMANSMNEATFIRNIGKARATVVIGLTNLV